MLAIESSPGVTVADVAVGPGRMYRGNKVCPRFPATDVPLAANALSSLCSSLHSRPGPVDGVRSGVNRALLSGKSCVFSGTIPPSDVPVVFSQYCLSTAEPHQPFRFIGPGQANSIAASAEVAVRPGRTYHGNEECPRSPVTVAPPISSSDRVCSSSPSRPGPVRGLGCGGFRPVSSGEYACIDPNSLALNGCTLQRPGVQNGVISVYYQNVRGLRTKIDDIFLASRDCGHDVIILTETNLNDDITSLQLFGTSFNVFRCDRSRDNSEKQSFGGVLIAVSATHSNAHQVETARGRHLEQVCVAANIQGESLLFCAIYIPPEKRSDVNLINEHIATIDELRGTKSTEYTTVVCGDYNQSRVQWALIDGIVRPMTPLTAASALALVDGMDYLNLYQTNTVQNYFGRILDLVFCSSQRLVVVDEAASALALPVDSHHPPLVCNFPIFKQAQQPTGNSASSSERLLNYRKIDFAAMTTYLFSINWDLCLENLGVDEMANTFCSIIRNWMNRYVPTVQPRTSPAWSNCRLRKLKRLKNACQRALRRRRSVVNKMKFRRSSDAYRKLNSTLYKSYVLRVQTNLRRNPRGFWRFVNAKRKCNDIPSGVFLDQLESDSPEMSCDLFAQHFASVFAAGCASDEEAEVAANNVPENLVVLSTFNVSADMVKQGLVKLKPSFSPGPDGIPSVVYRRCAEALVAPLLTIFNKSFSHQTFPSTWKQSFMTPVHKSGDKRNVKNYRGITNLSAASKLFEIIVSGVIQHQAMRYLSDEQHGFIPKRSVTTNLLEFTSTCIGHLENKAQVDVIYTDLKAAFDRIDHNVLLRKLFRLGLSASLINWLRSYLVGRSLRVRLGSNVSAVFVNNSGVPQGSNLGPLLFILFFNDVLHLLRPDCALVYADDLKLFLPIKTTGDCCQLQDLLDLFVSWCRRNKLSVSIPKCMVMSFTRRKQLISFDYSIDGVILQKVEQVRDLGVLMDPKLTFDLQRASVISKANRQLGFISRISKDFRDPYCLKSLYCSLVRPILEYAAIVWLPYQLTWILRIERVQKRFIRRTLRNLPWRDPANLPSYLDRCRLLNIHSLEFRRKTQQATFLAKLLNGEVDSPKLLSLINFRTPQRTLRESTLLAHRFHRTAYGFNEPVTSMIRAFTAVENLFEFGESSTRFRVKIIRTLGFIH